MADRHSIVVSHPEAGSKLIRFLERRLAEVPKTMLHKWVRTGQVRINGKRSKPFALLVENDSVRLPPFAYEKTQAPGPVPSPANRPGQTRTPKIPPCSHTARLQQAGLIPVAIEADYVILSKPSGLPVQGGTGHKDSVVERLRHAYADSVVVPAPVHRLDINTTGLLTVGLTQQALRDLSHDFASPGAVIKEYLAVVSGTWPFSNPVLLSDRLEKDSTPGNRVLCAAAGTLLPLNTPSWEKSEELLMHMLRTPASCPPEELPQDEAFTPAKVLLSSLHAPGSSHLLVQPLTLGDGKLPRRDTSLLRVCLLTGAKHQIRVQLASRGYPILGDTKYQGADSSRLFLHACLLQLRSKRYKLIPAWLDKTDMLL